MGAPAEMVPILSLESLDGTRRIPLDNTAGWIRMPGATGLEMPPIDLISAPVPGVPGSVLQDVRVAERPVFLPIYGSSSTGQASFLEMLDSLRSLIDPLTGAFKIVGITARNTRELVVTYADGLEGADGADARGLSWCKVGLRAIAHSPYAQAREDRTVEFRISGEPSIFMGTAGGTDAPWPTALASTAVIGEGMEVRIYSDAPVYPTLSLVGAMDSFRGTLSPVIIGSDGGQTITVGGQWYVDVPAGVPGGSTLRMVTDPRARSIRLDGALAAGRVARGSSLRPFYPGLNVLDVVAPGGSADTRIILSWRELYRSLW